MKTALYNVTFRRPDSNPKPLATVRAVRQRGPAGNWFDGVQDIMTPDTNAIRDALPYYHRRAFDRDRVMWHTSETLHASCTLYSARGKVLGTIHCEGYERE